MFIDSLFQLSTFNFQSGSPYYSERQHVVVLAVVENAFGGARNFVFADVEQRVLEPNVESDVRVEPETCVDESGHGKAAVAVQLVDDVGNIGAVFGGGVAYKHRGGHAHAEVEAAGGGEVEQQRHFDIACVNYLFFNGVAGAETGVVYHKMFYEIHEEEYEMYLEALKACEEEEA